MMKWNCSVDKTRTHQLCESVETRLCFVLLISWLY